MNALLDQVSTHRKNIKHEAITFSVYELVNMYHEGDVVIRPDFQRLFRWDRQQQSDFIESLLLEIPIPPIFFFENKAGTWELLDGLQRFSTLVKFISAGEVEAPYLGEAANEDEWHYNTQNNLGAPLQLLECEYLKALGGISFSRLPASLQLNLKRSRLHVVVLKRETDESYKYEVFKRLNRSGAKLAEQELRNCTVRMIDSKFPDFLQRIAENKDFVSSLGAKLEDERDGTNDEYALRFFTMKNYGSHFTHDVGALLTQYMEDVAANKIAFDYDHEQLIFEKTFALINEAFESGKAFRSRDKSGNLRGGISPTLFELCGLAVAKNLTFFEGLEPMARQAELQTLIDEAKSKAFTGGGSNSITKTKGRLALASTWSTRNDK